MTCLTSTTVITSAPLHTNHYPNLHLTSSRPKHHELHFAYLRNFASIGFKLWMQSRPQPRAYTLLVFFFIERWSIQGVPDKREEITLNNLAQLHGSVIFTDPSALHESFCGPLFGPFLILLSHQFSSYVWPISDAVLLDEIDSHNIPSWVRFALSFFPSLWKNIGVQAGMEKRWEAKCVTGSG
jgi:hypothetical protein